MGRAQGAKLFGITTNVHVPFDVGLRNLYGNQYIRANNAWDSSQVNGTGSQEPKFGKSPYVRQTVWQSDKILCSKKTSRGKVFTESTTHQPLWTKAHDPCVQNFLRTNLCSVWQSDQILRDDQTKRADTFLVRFQELYRGNTTLGAVSPY